MVAHLLWFLPSLFRRNFKEEDVRAWAAQIHNWEQNETEPRGSNSSLLCVWVCFSFYVFTAPEFIWLIEWSKWIELRQEDFSTSADMQQNYSYYCWAKRSQRCDYRQSAIHLPCKLHAEWKLTQIYWDAVNEACLLAI